MNLFLVFLFWDQRIDSYFVDVYRFFIYQSIAHTIISFLPLVKVGLVDLVTPPCGKNITTVKKLINQILAQCHYQQTLTDVLLKKQEKNKKRMFVNPLNPKIKI